jgi:hypothetical protein
VPADALQASLGVMMTGSHRHPYSLFITLFFILSVMLVWDNRSAFSAGNPCEIFIPRNFEKLSLDKKIKVSEGMRECERRLKESHMKDFVSPQKETKPFAYINARANRRAY